jgi:two-component system, chemotaxis family, chemotaxis protein CheY
MNLCLIVDDSEIVRKYAALIFESLGFSTIEADSAKAATIRLAGEAPHIILADWRLPGENTLDFIAQVRRKSLNRRPFILYLATENDVAEMERAARAGADDYLLKPFNREIVQAKLLDIRLAA